MIGPTNPAAHVLAVAVCACWMAACGSYQPGPNLIDETERLPGDRPRSRPAPPPTGKPEKTPDEIRKDRVKAALQEYEQGRSESLMTALENRLLVEINGLRQYPPAYVKTLEAYRGFYQGDRVSIPGHIAVSITEGRAAVDEAIKEVRQTPSLSKLSYSRLLTVAARKHARDLSTRPELRHTGSDGSSVHERIARYGRVEGVFAENIAAVFYQANWLVAAQLVDDGVASRVDRIHLLAPMFSEIGIGCHQHTQYHVVCVINLVESFDGY